MQKLMMQKLKMLAHTTVISTALIAASSASMAATTDYQIDSKHTATLFSWSHFGFSNPTANFNDVQGVISVDDKHPEKSSVSVTIPVKSVDSHVEALDKEFLTDAWFNEAKYPDITFKSTKVQTKDKKHFKITGDLTVKGVTKPARPSLRFPMVVLDGSRSPLSPTCSPISRGTRELGEQNIQAPI